MLLANVSPAFSSAAALYVFDFDGTLFDIPGPIEGKKEYMLTAGRPWPQAGWYGQSETLLPPLKYILGRRFIRTRHTVADRAARQLC